MLLVLYSIDPQTIYTIVKTNLKKWEQSTKTKCNKRDNGELSNKNMEEEKKYLTVWSTWFTANGEGKKKKWVLGFRFEGNGATVNKWELSCLYMGKLFNNGYHYQPYL